MRGWRASSRPAFGYCTQPAGRTRRTRSRAVRVYTWTLNRCAPHGSHHSAAQEVVLTAGSDSGAIHTWKVAGTTFLQQSAPNSSLPRGAAVIAAGLSCPPQWVAAAQAGKPAIHVWRWGKEGMAFKCATPERMGPLLATPDGAFLFAGGSSGKLYAWEVCSGELLSVVDAHFKAISALTMSDDGAYVASAGDDASIHVWLTSTLVDEGIGDASARKPQRSWTENSLAVTDLAFGAGGAFGRLFASSLDRTLHVFEVVAGKPVSTTVLPEGLLSLCVHPSQALVYAGGSEGSLFEVDLRHSQHQRQQEEEGGDAQFPSHVRRWRRHEQGVSCIATSADGGTLVCGSLDGSATVWDAASGQVVATYTGHTGPVTFAAMVLCPTDSRRRAGGGDGAGSAAPGSRAAVPLAPFKKFPGTRAAEPCTVALHGSDEVVAPAGTNVVAGAGGDLRAWGDGVAALLGRPERHHGALSTEGAEGAEGGADAGALRGRVAELEAETEALRAELAEAKGAQREKEVEEGQARAQQMLSASVQQPKAKRARRRQQQRRKG